MKKYYLHLTILLGALIVLPTNLFGQTTAEINRAYGYGYGGGSSCFYGVYDDARTQYIFTAQELAFAGMQPNDLISSLQWHLGTVNSSQPYSNFNIKMALVPVTQLNAAKWVPDAMTIMYTGDVDLQGLENTWITMVFGTGGGAPTFEWDGSSSIVIETCFDNTSYTNNDQMHYSRGTELPTQNLNWGGNVYNADDGAAGCSLSPYSWHYYRPVTKLTWSSSTPTPTITTSGSLSAFTSCSGTVSSSDNFTVSGTNLTANIVVVPPSGFQVSKSSGGGWAGFIEFTPSSGTVGNNNVYVRLSSSASGTPSGNVVSSSTNATSVNEAASGTVSTAPTPPTSISGTSSICNGSSTTLTAAGGSAGSGCTYQWGTGSTVGSNTIGSATSSSYSPSPSSTTTYWVRRVGNTGCTNTTGGTTQAVTVNSLPSVTVNSPSFCTSGSTTITATPSGGSSTYSTYAWTVPIGQSAPGNVASYTATVAGNHACVVTDNAGCVSSSGSGTVTATALTYTWDGESNSDWATAANWSCDIAPGSSSDVTIADVSTQPSISSGVTVATLTVNSSADLTLNSGNVWLTVSGATDNNGTSNSANASFDANGDFDASTGTVNFTHGNGKLVLSSTVTNLGTLDDAMGTVEYDGAAGSGTVDNEGIGSGNYGTGYNYPTTTPGGFWNCQTTGDDGDWYGESNATTSGSSNTGPSAPNTGDDYIYCETSSGHNLYTAGQTAYLESDAITDAGVSISFYYYMHGTDMGTLSVESYDGSSWTSRWSLSGEQQTASNQAWVQVTEDLAAYTVTKLRFKYTAAGDLGGSSGGWEGDIALDDIVITYVTSAPDIVAGTYFSLEIDGIQDPAGALDVNGDLTVNSSKSLDMEAYALNVAGDISNSGTLDLTGNTTTLDGSSTQSINALTANNLTVTNTSGTVVVGGALTITGTLSMSGACTADVNGTFDASNAAVTFTGAGHLKLGSTVTSLGTLTQSTGTVEYDAAGAQTVIAETYYNLEIDGSGAKSMAGDVSVSNDLTLSAGTFDLGTDDLKLWGDMTGSGSLTASGNAYFHLKGTGSQSINAFSDYGIKIKVNNPGGTVTTTGDIDADYIWMQTSAGTFVIDGEAVSIDRKLDCDGGTFRMTGGSFINTSNTSTNNTCDGGTIDIQGGTFKIGDPTDNSADLNIGGGTLTVSGSGTVNIADELDVSTGTVTQTGGTINIAYYTGTGAGTSDNKFDMDAGTLNLTAGTLNLQGQASSYDAMEIASGVTVNANANHTIGITSTGTGDEDVNLDLNGHDIGAITMNNSSYTGTLTSGGVILGDMTVTAGVLDIGTATATLTGDFTMPSGVGLDMDNATISIGGSSEQTITTNGGAIGNIVVNNSSSTGLVMADDMTISGTLTLTDGTINTNSNTLIMTSTTASDLTVGDNTSFIIANAAGPFRRHIASNTSTYSFPVGQGSATTDYYRMDMVNGSLSGNGFTYLDVYVKTNVETGNNVDSRVTASEGGTAITNMWNKEWMIVPDNEPSSGTFGIKLFTENISGLEDNKFTVFKRLDNSTDYADYGNGTSSSTSIPTHNAAGRTIASGYAQKTGFTPPMAGTSGGDGDDNLPIQLLEFNAKANDEGTVDVTWTTATEINNEFFTIERSLDGVDFETVLEREGSGTSNQLIEYATVDENPLLGTSYYRLKQTDYDGSFEYSELQAVNVLKTLNFSVRPNPATDRLQITFGEIAGGSVFVMTPDYKASIRIYNTAGKLVYKKKFDGNFYKFNIDVSNFDEGMYLVNLETAGQVYNTKFLKE